jgi:hypothetical protein
VPHRRILLSLVVILSFSALAAADSVPANFATPHFAAGTNYHFSNAANSTPVFSEAFGIHPAVRERLRGVSITSSFSTGMSPLGGMRPTRNTNDNWKVQGMSTPEPGGLMLLSTGLLGIAGVVRRKLLRGC